MRYKIEVLLVFYQILFPLCDTFISRIWEDKWIPYYSEVKSFSNLSSCQIVIGGSYFNGFKPLNFPEMLIRDECIERCGVRGGTSGSVYWCCQMGADYDDYIVHGMNYRLWIQIKEFKTSATTEHQQRKYKAFITWSKNSIEHGDALFATSIFSQSTPNLISVGMRQVGNHRLMRKRGLRQQV